MASMVASPEVRASLDRLSSTVRTQRSKLADSLATLQAELNAHLEPRKGTPPDGTLDALRSQLAAAARSERNEAADSGGMHAELERLRLELALANDEISRRGEAMRSLELRLRARDASREQLGATEAELEQRARLHEAAMAGMVAAQHDLEQQLHEARMVEQRQSDELAAAREELRVLRERGSAPSEAAEAAAQLVELERVASEAESLVRDAEAEANALREANRRLTEEVESLEEQISAEIARGAEVRCSLATERSSRRSMEAQLRASEARIYDLQTRATTSREPTDDDDDDDGSGGRVPGSRRGGSEDHGATAPVRRVAAPVRNEAPSSRDDMPPQRSETASVPVALVHDSNGSVRDVAGSMRPPHNDDDDDDDDDDDNGNDNDDDVQLRQFDESAERARGVASGGASDEDEDGAVEVFDSDGQVTSSTGGGHARVAAPAAQATTMEMEMEMAPPTALLPLRVEGRPMLGHSVHVTRGGAAVDDAPVAWWRMSEEAPAGAAASSSASSAVSGYQVEETTGAEYHCTSEDVGCAVRGEWEWGAPPHSSLLPTPNPLYLHCAHTPTDTAMRATQANARARNVA